MDPVKVTAKFEVRSFICSWDKCGYLKTLGSPWILIDFGTNRKYVCDFLLVRHSNLGPILHRFGDIVGFLCSWVTHLYSTLILGRSRCTRAPMLGSARAEALSYSYVKLYLKYSNLDVKHTSTSGQTDGRTDDLLWHNGALRSIAR